MNPELRALLVAEIRQRMGSSALKQYPRLQGAQRKDPEFSREAALMLVDTVDQLMNKSTTIVDPVTSLDLLPTPAHLFSNRLKDFGAKISPEEFLNRAWRQHTAHHLLYSEHVRRIDLPLYSALQYRSSLANKTQADFMFELGIMTREQINHPPRGYERQAELLRSVRNRLRAQAIFNHALVGPEK